MEEIKQRIYTVRCSRCGTVFGLHPDNLSEKELARGSVACPKCGAPLRFGDAGPSPADAED